ncbi:MAG: ATP-binding protein [Myxococcota bacterium]|jgi:hypothetical protein
MRLPFLDRERETERLTRCFNAAEGTLSCLYGRRRCGKSRLISEAIKNRSAVFYVGDERNAALQRLSLSKSVASLIKGFDTVSYPDWDSLFGQFFDRAPEGLILVLDEFPWMVQASPELPGLLQKRVDTETGRRLHIVLCGSSQRMMQGLVLDRSAPLFGRAREILEIKPLGLHWLDRAAGFGDARKTIEAYAVWGGVPRYWELAFDHKTTLDAVRDIVLDPLGVLHREPESLLFDDMRELSQAASVLSAIGQGCHKLSEIAGRLGHPATALARPLQRLAELGLVRKEIPYGVSERDNKRSLYKINDPFLRFWFRYVEQNRSMLSTGQLKPVEDEIRSSWSMFLGPAWEDLARSAVPFINVGGVEWRTASRWWGTGADRKPMEMDIMASSADGESLLFGESKLSLDQKELPREAAKLLEKSLKLPNVGRKRLVHCIFTVDQLQSANDCHVISAADVIGALK